jgi:hypothetical protein
VPSVCRSGCALNSLCVSFGFAGIDRMERTERTYRYPEVWMDVSLKCLNAKLYDET